MRKVRAHATGVYGGARMLTVRLIYVGVQAGISITRWAFVSKDRTTGMDFSLSASCSQQAAA